jgi:hypothetical protein
MPSVKIERERSRAGRRLWNSGIDLVPPAVHRHPDHESIQLPSGAIAMGVLDWLDPTRSWPEVPGPAPELSRITMQLEGLRFGDPIESARSLGRPDRFEWRSRVKKDCDLVYARKGLRLRFTRGHLSEVGFLIAPGSSDLPGFAPSRPLAPDGTRLGPEADRARIVALFGQPDPGGSDQTVLQVFHQRGVASDFFLDEQGHLKEWALYPND